MKFSRFGSAAAIIAAGALVLTGCSGGGSSSESTSSASSVITTNGSEPESGLIPSDTNEVGGGKIIDEVFAGLRYYAADGKPVAAICHAPWLLVETGLADGRELTSVPTIRTDLTNAGGRWADEMVVVDDSTVRLVRRADGGGADVVQRMRGRRISMTTDEIMALTRSDA